MAATLMNYRALRTRLWPVIPLLGITFAMGAGLLTAPPEWAAGGSTSFTPASAAPAPRVVSIGDIHGDLASFRAILRRAAITDARGRWVTSNTTLVQTGDAIDRGPNSRAVLDLLMELEKQAPRKKSRLVPLLGNHEVMNITGDLRYVSVQEYAEFAGEKSEKRRQQAWKDYVKWSRERARKLGQPEPAMGEEPDAAWLEAHPLGFFEHREAYSATGKYGKWLRGHDAVALVEGTLFVHGGLSTVLAEQKLEEINKRVLGELKLFDDYMQFLEHEGLALPFFTLSELAQSVQEELAAKRAVVAEKQAQALAEGTSYEPSAEEKRTIETLEAFLQFPTWYSIHADGPLWFRGYARWPAAEAQPLVERVLAAQGARAIVVGHTPLKNGRIATRFGGKVFLIDTGMLTGYYEGGRASALEMAQSVFTAIYPDARAVLWPSSAPELAVPASTPSQEEPQKPPREEEPGGGLAPAQGAAKTNSGSGQPAPAGRWRDPEGKLLPFRTDEELIEFLRTAEVVAVKNVGRGVTRPKKVLLERDGVRMHAIFRDVNTEKDVAKLRDGSTVRFFRDSYLLDSAAYELSRMLGLDNVPPVAERMVRGKQGSVQAWVENAFTEAERVKRKMKPPDVERWSHQMQTLRLFDLLISNADRNAGNIIVDPEWKLWMVDHTRTFRREADLPYLNQIVLCERGLRERLRKVPEPEIRRRLGGVLRGPELEALLVRRRRIVEYLDVLVAEKGEATVLFSW